ncbi:MAG: DUF559 domain-containing protein [Ignavibacteriales bacterium]|nr:DUF559 domain-containing protein [Ignavibacteriales bacterium]
MERYLHYSLIHLARKLRKGATEAEGVLWEQVRGRRLNGLKFRRQHPIGSHKRAHSASSDVGRRE